MGQKFQSKSQTSWMSQQRQKYQKERLVFMQRRSLKWNQRKLSLNVMMQNKSHVQCIFCTLNHCSFCMSSAFSAHPTSAYFALSTSTLKAQESCTRFLNSFTWIHVNSQPNRKINH